MELPKMKFLPPGTNEIPIVERIRRCFYEKVGQNAEAQDPSVTAPAHKTDWSQVWRVTGAHGRRGSVKTTKVPFYKGTLPKDDDCCFLQMRAPAQATIIPVVIEKVSKRLPNGATPIKIAGVDDRYLWGQSRHVNWQLPIAERVRTDSLDVIW
eukprot:GHVN01097280.1.p2 GENE.GHVN01097280.1~~GHVN01097280.1.p2  ORF type:complete len:153 (-),score=13.57 GHVN01097280.1:677-1135(-)